MFYLGSREATTALFGRPLWGWADPYSDTVVLAWNDERTLFNRHEIMHVLAWNLWGLAAQPFGWISEGLAVYAQGSCRNHDLLQLARVLRNRGDLYGVDRLTQQFWQLDEVVAYVEAGSLVRFPYEVYGREATRRLWHGGVAEAEEALGVSLADLEAMWHRHLDTVIPTREAEAWRAETC